MTGMTAFVQLVTNPAAAKLVDKTLLANFAALVAHSLSRRRGKGRVSQTMGCTALAELACRLSDTRP